MTVEPTFEDRALEVLLRHSRSPHVSAGAHLYGKRLALEKEIRDKTKIYLDQNYWIDLTYASEGRGKPQFKELLDILTSKVDAGRIICPAGEVVLIELLKTPTEDARTRIATLVERLSGGVAIDNFP